MFYSKIIPLVEHVEELSQFFEKKHSLMFAFSSNFMKYNNEIQLI